MSTSQQYEIIVSRNGVSIEWWCAKTLTSALACWLVEQRRVESHEHRAHGVDDYAASGTIFIETPNGGTVPILIRRREHAESEAKS
jgi:hypothetical protein